MISYAEAVEIFNAQEKPKWDYPGEFYVAPDGYQNDEFYLLPYGPKEYVEMDDTTYEIADLPAALVNKRTGEVSFITALDNLQFIDAFEPI